MICSQRPNFGGGFGGGGVAGCFVFGLEAAVVVFRVGGGDVLGWDVDDFEFFHFGFLET